MTFRMDTRQQSPTAASFLPPAIFEEATWDILLALHSDRGCQLSLEKLARITSIPGGILHQWLGRLEQQNLVGAAAYGTNREVRAVLTPAGRGLLEGYLIAASKLEFASRT